MNSTESNNALQQSFIFASAALFAVLIGCVTLEETGESVFLLTSPQQEAQLGEAAFKNIKKNGKVSKEPAANERVLRVLSRFLPHAKVSHAKWEAVVIEDKTPNAFALPGGKIGVHTGLLPLCETDDMLAAVIGHEIAHVTLRHGGQRYSEQIATSVGTTAAAIAVNEAIDNGDPQSLAMMMGAFGVAGQVGVSLPYSRKHEYEADVIGVRYMAQAGYDPRAAITFWERMMQHGGSSPPEFLSTHPADANRIRKLKESMPAALAIYEQSRTSP